MEAIGGREWLVEDGAVGIRPVSSFTTEVHPRTAVGIRSDGRLLLATVDGRQPGYSIGMTAADLAAMLMAQGAVEAIMLDGGGSTTALVRRPGDVEASLVNRPSAGYQRAVDNALLVVSSVPTGPLASLVLRPSSRTMVVGQAASFSAHGVDAAMNGIPIAASAVAWSMTGSGATLSSSGRFQAREPGSATVTAAAAGLAGASDMSIVADTFAPVAADPDLRLRRGGTVEAGSVPVTVSWAAADRHRHRGRGLRAPPPVQWPAMDRRRAAIADRARDQAAPAARHRRPVPAPCHRSVQGTSAPGRQPPG